MLLLLLQQIAGVVSTFSIGPERVAAASLLFTRASDAASELVSLTGMMSGHDLLGFKEVLGWYAGYRWNQPTGEAACGIGGSCDLANLQGRNNSSNNSFKVSSIAREA
jgi:hypothetical protein